MKKLIAAVLFALALTAAAPVANAEIDMPVCYPCDRPEVVPLSIDTIRNPTHHEKSYRRRTVRLRSHRFRACRERRDRYARLLSLRRPEVTPTYIKEPDPS